MSLGRFHSAASSSDRVRPVSFPLTSQISVNGFMDAYPSIVVR